MQSPGSVFTLVKVMHCRFLSQAQICATNPFVFSRNKSKPVVGPATNNRGEIQAVTQAIQDASEHGVRKLCINSDSHFVINSVTKWMKSWKARGWRLANGGPVKNIVDFQALDHAIRDNQQLEIKWNYVPAHVGIRGNERADELAKLGATFYRSA